MIIQPFSPQYGSNQVVTAGASSAAKSINKDSKQVRVVNTGANKGYFRIYDSSNGAQAATIADCPVVAGTAVTVTKGGNQDTIAYISASGTTLEVMTGEGF
jgi:hypothetical protein